VFCIFFEGLLPEGGGRRGFTGDTPAAGVFLGDGEGGRTLGSLDRNFLAGVLCLDVVEIGFFLIVMGFVVGEGMVSSGNFARFNRRRTSYANHQSPQPPQKTSLKSTTLCIQQSTEEQNTASGIEWDWMGAPT